MDKIDIRKANLKFELMIISIVAFLVTLIGVSFSWLSGDMITGSTNLFVGSASLTMNYHGTSSITNVDLAPGEKFEKTFEVTNDANTVQTYNILWRDVTNSLINKNYFMYTIENVTTGEQLFLPKYLPTNSTHIVYDISVPANTTNNYKLTIYYVADAKYSQTLDSNLAFTGDITIDSANSPRTDEEVLSIYVNGVHSDYLPTLSSYTIDTTRTFCTNGSSISIVNGSISISNKTSTTACELYLVSGTPTAITGDPYNLLVIDLDGATLKSSPKTTYRYSGDIIDLGVPEKSGYAFLGWQVSGGGTTIIENTKVVMGTTYSYVKPTWAHGYWNKTTQTCTQGAPTSYTREYKTCNENIDNYTKVEKTCGVSSWSKTTSVCGVTQVTKASYVCGRTYHANCSWGSNQTKTIQDCTTNSPSCTSGAEKITACVFDHYAGSCACTGNSGENYSWPYNGTQCSNCSCVCGLHSQAVVSNRSLNRYYVATYQTCSCNPYYSYGFPSSASSTTSVAPSACTASTPSCSEYSHYNNGNTKVTCGDPKTYGWTSSNTVTDSTCTASGSCSASTNGNSYVTGCTPLAYNFGAESSPTTVGSCTDNLISCSSSTNGQTNRVCTPNYSYTFGSVVSGTSEVCSPSSFSCSENTVGDEYTTSCTPIAYDYGYVASTVQSGSCFVSNSHNTCASGTVNQTYISTCELIEN